MVQSLRLEQSSRASSVFPDLEPVVDSPAPRKPVSARNLFSLRQNLSSRQRNLGSIQATTMSFRTMHEHGTLLTKYLEARKSIFIDRLHWQVGEADGMEFDQYDTPACRWVVLHEFGEIVGGVRLLPTTARCGIYTYMLRDAQRGLLESLPTDVLFFEAPVKANIWEASRFFITDIVPSARRAVVQHELFQNMTLAAKENGASRLIGIVPSVWSRWSRRIGVGATPIGAKFSIDGTVSQSVLFDVNGHTN